MSLTNEERQRIIEEERLRESVRQQATSERVASAAADFIVLAGIIVGMATIIGLIGWIIRPLH
jgi:hypothetical protein